MLSAAFTGGIISYFEEALAAQVALTAFIPMLMDTGGNCGSQSSVTVIRGLALGEMSLSDWGRVLWKELRISSMCAVALAAVNFVRLMAMSTVGLSVAAVVSLTLAVTVIVSDLDRRAAAHPGPADRLRPGGDGQPPDHYAGGRRLAADLFQTGHMASADVSPIDPCPVLGAGL